MNIKKIVLLIWGVAFFSHLFAQCPTLFDLKVDGVEQTKICAPDEVELSVRGIQMPSKGKIEWFYGEDPAFDPRSQGTLIGTTNLPELNQVACPTVCPDLLMIMMNSCDGTGKEENNEFVILSSGGGFYASDFQFSVNAGTNDSGNDNRSINIGSNPCGIVKPSNAFMNRLRQGSCSNLNLFPAGPGDYIPADALVIFFMSNNVTIDYNLNTLCGSGHNVYVMQNSCSRTMGAFTNVLSNPSSTNRTRNNMFSLKNCSACKDSLNYSLEGTRNQEGEYIVDKDFPLASVSNGAILLNTQGDPCQTPDLSNYLKPNTPYTMKFPVAVNSPLCGKTVYFKAYVTPSDESICQEIIAEGASLQIQCGGGEVQADATKTVCSGNPLKIEFAVAGDYKWTVNAPASVSGLSSGSGNVEAIEQIPIYNGTQPVSVTYLLESNSTDCPVSPVTVTITIGPQLDATISGNTNLCNGESTTLSVNSPGNQILWSNGSTSSSITVQDAGSYSVTISNGICDATDEVDVVVQNELTPSIYGKLTICQGESTTLTVVENYDSYVWSDGQTGKSIVVSQLGTYSVTVTSGTCAASTSVTVTENASLNLDVTVQPVTCVGNDGSATVNVLDAVVNTILWNTGETTYTISNKAAGVYTYEISYLTCKVQGSVNISVDSNALDVEVNVQPVSCDGSQLGSIEVTDIFNGQAPYQYLLDGAPVTDFVTDLAAGTYVLTILDDEGCRMDKNIAVEQSPDVTVEFLGDLSIIEGQSVLLQAEITGTHIQPEKNIYTWTPSFGLDCSDCREPMASPSESTEYVLQVQNAFGCWDEDTILVEVKPALLVFIPKAFSPNGDGVNDILYIFTKNEDVKIKVFEIFNRWGHSIFKVENVEANNPAFGWDGTMGGNPAPMDNYLYYYEVEFSDQSTQRNEGGVAIIR